jgi:hypothetical protein
MFEKLLDSVFPTHQEMDDMTIIDNARFSRDLVTYLSLRERLR